MHPIKLEFDRDVDALTFSLVIYAYNRVNVPKLWRFSINTRGTTDAGPGLTVHRRVYQDKAWAHQVLQGFARHLADLGVGAIGEIAHGDPPHQPDGYIAQAWSMAEVLRVWKLLETSARLGPGCSGPSSCSTTI